MAARPNDMASTMNVAYVEETLEDDVKFARNRRPEFSSGICKL